VKWEGGVADPDTASTTVTMDGDRSVTAVFRRLTGKLILDVQPSEGGTTDPDPGTHEYSLGEVVPLHAVPDTGYAFVKWEGGVADPDTASTTVTMDGDRSVTAVFERRLVRLTLVCDPENGGLVDPAKGTHKYGYGQNVTIKAEPKPGFLFVRWEGGVGEPQNDSTFVVMDSEKIVTAHFSTEDTVPPSLVDVFPPDGSSYIPRNTKIHFKAKDWESGVNRGSLQAWINGAFLVVDGVDQTGGRITIAESDRKINVVFHPTGPFPDGSTVTVRVAFEDRAAPPNRCDSTFSFAVGLGEVDTVAAAVVNETGGTVSDEGSGVRLEVPADALQSEVQITIEHVETLPPLPEPMEGMALAYHFGPDGLTFGDWVTVRLPFTQEDLDAAGVTDPAELKVYYFHTSSGKWSILHIDSVNAAAWFLFAKVREFCYLALLNEPKKVSAVGAEDPERPAAGMPSRFGLSQNYPNPFNPSTRVQFDLPKASRVTLTVVDATGRVIRSLVDASLAAGVHEAVWDGTNATGNPVATGVYCFTLRAGGKFFIRKALYVK
jgi:hypothetical protein